MSTKTLIIPDTCYRRAVNAKKRVDKLDSIFDTWMNNREDYPTGYVTRIIDAKNKNLRTIAFNLGVCLP